MALASDAEFFHTPQQETYASFDVSGHRETWRVGGRMFGRWLKRRMYKATGKIATAAAVNEAIGTLEARALFDGDERPVFTRVARFDEQTMYLDLTNDSWEVVEVSTVGWRVLGDAPVRFQRASGMLPLPHPERGGSDEDLRPFLNVPDQGDWVLVVSWLLGALRPERPYPVLVLQGEQGSAKSTTARFLRALIDPNAVPLRAEPREVRDLMIAASNAHAIVFDNLSNLRPWLSDALCRLATGGGFATRELYTDRDEILFEADRPVLLNGIEELATRSDLLDRSLVVSLPPISQEGRQPERTLVGDFERARARVLGALLDAVVTAMANQERVAEHDLPRMADFAVWICGAEESLGWNRGTFMEAYQANRRIANEIALEASVVANTIVGLARDGGFVGTATELLKALGNRAEPDMQFKRGWPKNPSHLSNLLKRLAPNLRAAGVEVNSSRSSDPARTRLIRISVIGDGAHILTGIAPVPSNDRTVEVDGADGMDAVTARWEVEEAMARAAIDSGILTGTSAVIPAKRSA